MMILMMTSIVKFSDGKEIDLRKQWEWGMGW